jgi:hypothetical protein
MASVFAEARTTDVRAAWVGRATDFYTYARVHAGLVSTLPHFNPPIVIIIQWFVVSAPERVHPSASRNGTPPRVPHVSHDASTRTPNESKFSFFFNSCVPVHHVTGYHSPTPTSRCVRCVVLASSPSRRRSRSDIPMRVVASRVARRASRTKQKQKTKTKRTLEEALETNAGEATARAAVAETVKDIVVRVRAVL